jgi:3-phenylpropionate/trans-cinnamate dioxygenase ferredoxin reductase component
MAFYRYLIVGAGMTGDAAARGIREADLDSPIGIIGDEPDPPYNRPPLSKGLWTGAPVESIWRQPAVPGVELHLGRRVQSLDLTRKCVVDDRGIVYAFEKCLLATGGSPRRLPFGDDQIIYLRTLRDYRRLRDLADRGQRFAVVGGGFVGSEIAAALATHRKQVTLISAREGVAARVLPRVLALSLASYFRRKGIDVRSQTRLTGLEARGEHVILKTRGVTTSDEQELWVDGVVAGLGLELNDALAQKAGLAVENGIVVDEFLRTSHPDVYAAGDVANFHNPALGRRLRVEHEDNANAMGYRAGRSMVRPEPYDYLPFFYSTAFNLSYQGVGDVDARLETIEDWEDRYRKGAIYYLADGRVRGVLTWNRFGQVAAARRLIAEPGPLLPHELAGRLREAS